MVRIDVFLIALSGLGAVSPAQDRATPGLAASDWSAIRTAHEIGQHRVFALAAGHRARNPGQQWTSVFDGRGFTVQPDSGGWEWGLELERWGFAGSERPVFGPAQVSAADQRVSYAWDELLEEWYVNDTRGLEHGYTIARRPEGGSSGGPLKLTLAVRGGLRPEPSADGRGVSFASGAGSAVLTYSGLTVLDADGERLSARFERVAEGLRLSIDEAAARYPLTIDPIAQQAYIKASNPGGGTPLPSFTFGDEFGTSVAFSGDTLVVGAYRERSSATGVNGDQSDNSALYSGAAYVFVRNGATWTQQAYLKASNTEAEDRFGESVAVSGDIVVVGAMNEDSDATGVNGAQNNNNSNLSGAAYVFVRNGTTWSQEAYLKASNAEEADRFGNAVAVSGETVVVGARTRDAGAVSTGAAYVFVRNGTTWSEEAYLLASIPGENDTFGRSVAVSGDTLVVGADGEDSSSTGVNGDENNAGATSSGAAYVFVRNGTTWTQEAYVKASNTNNVDHFGAALALEGDTLVVGAPDEDSHAKTVNGDQTSNRSLGAGAAYVFTRTGTTWSQEAYLKASNAGGGSLGGDPGDQFGASVALSGNTVVVGAWSEDSHATGVNGDQVSNSALESGAAYVFVKTGSIWSQRSYLKASNTASGDEFGLSVAVQGDTVVAGAPGEDSASSGVNGDPDDNSASAAGAVFVFEADEQSAVTFRNAGTNPASYTADPLLIGSSFTATVDNNVASQTTSMLFAFNTPFSFTLGGGQTLLCFDWQGVGELLTGGGLLPSSSAAGIDSFSLPFPNDPALIGFPMSSQAIQFGIPPFKLSNAQDLTIGSF